MKTTLLALCAALCLLPSCSTTGGAYRDLFISYTGDGVEVSNSAIVAAPGKESTTANGAGYNLKLKKGYVSFVDGHQEDFRITGAGFGGGVIALNLEGGGRVKINVNTGELTMEGSRFSSK